MVSKIQLTTEQKHHIASAIDQLESNSNRPNTEEIALSVLKAILPERLPTRTQLLSNYPNPFNPETWIPFKLAQDSTVTAKIYDVTGKQIRMIEVDEDGQLDFDFYLASDVLASTPTAVQTSATAAYSYIQTWQYLSARV